MFLLVIVTKHKIRRKFTKTFPRACTADVRLVTTLSESRQDGNLDRPVLGLHHRHHQSNVDLINP